MSNSTTSVVEPAKSRQRLLSLDFLRGLTMVLLTLESAGLYTWLEKAAEGSSWGEAIMTQFGHHAWHGLHFWDLVQPVFMSVAGTAMAFSIQKQSVDHTWGQRFRKTLKRSGWLFFWGVLDYAVRKEGLSFELWDVLTQLSFATLIAFLIIDWSIPAQIIVSIGCLLIPEFLYRYTHVAGFDQPFTDQHNFGNYIDWVLMRKINHGGWVAINCISTTAHVIWGVLAGKLLLSSRTSGEKMKYLLGSSALLLLLGFGLDWTGITPIIKKIATSSFVLASGGWFMLFLAICYWWVDIQKHQKNLLFFFIFGMNSIFIYLFFEIVGDRWFTAYIMSITDGLLGFISFPIIAAKIIGSLVVSGLEAGILYFLYRKKIFFKL